MATDSTTRAPRTVVLPRKGEVPISNTYRFRKAAPTRLERAELLVEAGAVKPLGDGHYFVESASARLEGRPGEGYHVDATAESCQCKDFERGNVCMHLLAVDVYRDIIRQSVRPHLRPGQPADQPAAVESAAAEPALAVA